MAAFKVLKLPCIARLQNMCEICSRRKQMFDYCAPTFSSQLAVPRRRRKGFGDHAFNIASPRLWNVLPGSITDCKSSGGLKKKL